MKVNINGQGHMTKIATMAINSKNLYKFYSPEPKTYDFETMPEASVNGALQSLYNHDPRDDLDLDLFLWWGQLRSPIPDLR